MRALIGLAAALLPACSLILDFDDLRDLPCPCDQDHACLRSANRCVPRASVELFKSCDQDTENGGDDLCPSNAVCVSVNGQGPRCLASCAPGSYALPEAGEYVRNQCPTPATTCWPSEKGGVCDEGVCSTTPNNCRPPQQCAVFNGAGVCFTPCQIFEPSACGGGDLCHPVGDTSITACFEAGPRQRTELCSLDAFCASADPDGRPMVCGRALSSQSPKRCWPICRSQGDCLRPGARCVVAAVDIIPATGEDLQICEEGT